MHLEFSFPTSLDDSSRKFITFHDYQAREVVLPPVGQGILLDEPDPNWHAQLTMDLSAAVMRF